MAQLPDTVRKLLDSPNFAHISTLNPDGSPQSSVVWIEYDGEHILVNTAEGRVKTRNVRLDPRVAISIYDQNNPYEAASIRGRVVELTHDGADAHIDKLAKKYMGVDSYPYRTPEEQRVTLKIEPLAAAAR